MQSTLGREPTTPRRPLRSIGAVLAGFLATAVVSLGTDHLLHMLEVYPPWGEPMAGTHLWLLATAYRTVYGIGGGYLAACLAPRRPLAHALALGVLGLVVSIAGSVAAYQAGPELGPLWYALVLVVLAVPTAGAGGWLYQRRKGA